MVKKDFAAAAVILAIAAAVDICTRLAPGGETVTVRVDGEIYARYPLNEERVININGTNTLVIADGSAYMSQASCPDKLCMHQGQISSASKSIACLPNKVVVTVDANNKEEVDAVAR